MTEAETRALIAEMISDRPTDTQVGDIVAGMINNLATKTSVSSIASQLQNLIKIEGIYFNKFSEYIIQSFAQTGFHWQITFNGNHKLALYLLSANQLATSAGQADFALDVTTGTNVLLSDGRSAIYSQGNKTILSFPGKGTFFGLVVSVS